MDREIVARLWVIRPMTPCNMRMLLMALLSGVWDGSTELMQLACRGAPAWR
jgi:hypothetical protein